MRQSTDASLACPHLRYSSKGGNYIDGGSECLHGLKTFLEAPILSFVVHPKAIKVCLEACISLGCFVCVVTDIHLKGK